jgi:hypothetical protein
MTALDTTAMEAAPLPATGLSATLRHARHVVTGNPITGFSFTLFILLLICAPQATTTWATCAVAKCR